MKQDQIDMYIMTNQKYLPADKIVFIKQKMQEVDDEKFSLISALEYKDPMTILLVSIMLGDTGMGILKLLTMGLCGVLTIVDWFTVQKKAKDVNFQNLMMIL